MAADAKPPLVPDGVLSRDGACPVTVPPHGGISDARPPGGFRRGQPHLIDEQCECVHKSRLLTIVKLNAR